jgi:hypothetical protein
MGQLAVTAEKYVQLRVGSYVFNFLHSTPPTAAKSKTSGPSGGPCAFTSVKETLHLSRPFSVSPTNACLIIVRTR